MVPLIGSILLLAMVPKLDQLVVMALLMIVEGMAIRRKIVSVAKDDVENWRELGFEPPI